jgi:hypothetical protein
MDVAPTTRMDENLTQFEDVLGGCERILKTPVPLSCEEGSCSEGALEGLWRGFGGAPARGGLAGGGASAS